MLRLLCALKLSIFLFLTDSSESSTLFGGLGTDLPSTKQDLPKIAFLQKKISMSIKDKDTDLLDSMQAQYKQSQLNLHPLAMDILAPHPISLGIEDLIEFKMRNEIRI